MRRIVMYMLLLLAAPLAAQTDKDHNFKVAKNLEVFNTIYRNLDMMYVDTLDADRVVGGGINAMMASLDPYTEYYSEAEVQNLKTMMTGKYAGIGAEVRHNFKLDKIVIWEPYEGMPAAEAGLKKGDIILSIDDSLMENTFPRRPGQADPFTSYVSSHLRGDAGTTFELKIKRPSTGKVMKFKITRRAIQLPHIPYYGVKDGVGYLNLNSFTEDCSRDVRRDFLEMKRQGMRAFILDLRGNGGGLEQEAVNIVNMFVPKGLLIVSNKGKLARVNHDYMTTVEPIDTVMPIVVLVNGGTASASEITSGALQDLDRAVVLGTRTYGKGLVQMTMDLPYNGQMKFTTNKYYIPSGRCIQAINYKHGQLGRMEHVPDSLTKVFHTAHGREVRDGGGIMPDVVVQPDSMANITDYLFTRIDSQEVVQDFVVDYIARHPTIAPAGVFTLSDADFEAFKQRVVGSGFKYDQMTEKYLADLKKLATFEGYYEKAKPEFDALEKKLKHDVAYDLDYNKEEIKRMLALDIVPAYYYQSGAMENGLLADKQYDEAVRLLGDTERYRKILGR